MRIIDASQLSQRVLLLTKHDIPEKFFSSMQFLGASLTINFFFVRYDQSNESDCSQSDDIAVISAFFSRLSQKVWFSVLRSSVKCQRSYYLQQCFLLSFVNLSGNLWRKVLSALFLYTFAARPLASRYLSPNSKRKRTSVELKFGLPSLCAT